MKIFALFILALLLFSGCSRTVVHPAPTIEIEPVQEPKIVPPPVNDNWISDILHKEYKKWHHAPYKIGGSSKKGIDCSSLVQIVYRDGFGINLPRTTGEQATRGYNVHKNALEVGDLIFFKTGRRSKHAGIIIEKGKFMHASTDTGVTISQLNNPYWKNRYWVSRRVLP